MDHCIPLMFHVDGAEVFRNSEFHVFSWRSAFASHDEVLDTQLYMMSIPQSVMRQKRVRARIHTAAAKYIAWNMRFLESGTGPAVGFYGEEFPANSVAARLAGQPLAADGWHATFFGFHGDHKSRRECHQFQQHYNAMYICDGCFAVQPSKNAPKGLMYKDFRREAVHKSTRFDHTGYVRCPHVFGVSPWTAIPGWSLNLTFKDLMHVLLLGIARDFVANHIIAWLEGGMLDHIRIRLPPAEGEPPQEHALRILWLDFKKWCKDMGYGSVSGTTWTLVTLGRTKQTSHPELSSKFKAAVIKLMIPYVAERSAMLDRSNTRCAEARRINSRSLADFMGTLDKASFWLTDSEAESCIAHGTRFLETWQFLSHDAARNQEHRWHIRPKHHYYEHLKDDMHAWKANPLRLQCMAPETFMGRVKRLGLKCHGLSVLQRLPQRLILAYSVRWFERRRLQRWTLSVA